MTEPLDWSYELRVSEVEQATFRKLSGDENPLHFDPDYARRSGFAAPLVYGGLIVAKISGFLGSVFPGSGCVWSRLEIQFRQPLQVGQNATLRAATTHSSDDLGVWELSLKVFADDRTIAIGSVQVMRRTVKT